jgi:glycine oxidase
MEDDDNNMTDRAVTVIGAGVIGQAVTYELVRRGASVTLVDARGAGLGSTQAAAGMLVPYIEGSGTPLLPLAVRSLEMYDAFVERLSRDSGLRVGYGRPGSLQVTMQSESFDELLALAGRLRAMGVACDLLDARDVSGIEPQLASNVAGALAIGTHGFVVASDLSGALSAAAIRHGARVYIPARAHRISRRGDSLEIELDGDRIAATHVVVAAGSWSGQIDIDGVPPMPVRPVRGQLLQLACAGPALSRIVWGSRCYLVPAAPQAILVGATVEEAGFDERTTAEGVKGLLEAACDLMPGLRGSTFAGARVGLRPATTDEMPMIGASAVMPGLVYATGHFRNGVLLAPLTAAAVADLILDNRHDPLLACAAPQRFGEY